MIILLNKNEIGPLPIGGAKVYSLVVPVGTEIVKVDVDDLTLSLLVDMYIKDEK